jgi:hypothetical protein
MAQVSSPSKLTIGWPPEANSTLFWGRNRATTLMLLALDMVTTVAKDAEESRAG